MGEMYRYGGAPAETRFAEPRQGPQLGEGRFVDPYASNSIAVKRPRADFEDLASARGLAFSQPLQDDRLDRFSQYSGGGGPLHYGEQRGMPSGRALDLFPSDMATGYRDGPYGAATQQQMMQASQLGGVPLLRDEAAALHRSLDGLPRGMEAMLPRGIDMMPRGLIEPMGPGMEAMARGRMLMDPSLPPDGDPRDLLPPEASPTLFIEGLPSDCTRREAAHIFRPFIGFKEVRLVFKDAKRGPADSKIVLCFVEFADARCAATALEALQGYRLDEEDPRSPSLRLMFARHPGPRAGLSMRDERPSAGGYRAEYRFAGGNPPPPRGGPAEQQRGRRAVNSPTNRDRVRERDQGQLPGEHSAEQQGGVPSHELR